MILMRQQMNDFREHLRIIAILRSRSDTIAKCFKMLQEQGRLDIVSDQLHRKSTMSLARLSTRLSNAHSSRGFGRQALGLERTRKNLYQEVEDNTEELDVVGDAVKLQSADFIDKIIVFIADCVGSVWMLMAFIIGIICWISLGPK